MKSAVCILALSLSAVPSWAAVRVWQDTLSLVTYEEGPPNVDPPFPVFDNPNPVRYPYTVRLGFTQNRFKHAWRALHIENEYLSCVVLPDLGGRLYTCKDKLSGRDMFYANPTVKKADVGLRGAWAAMGIEMNFPTGHSWTTISPVDFATAQNPDGSASIWVGDIDRVYGMQWRVEFILRPDTAVLEQRVHLYNPTPARHRFYWWNNGEIELVDGKSRFIYPTHMVATHGLTEIRPWPVDKAGVDRSVIGNYKDGDGLFAHGSREPFMAVYQPSILFATVHYADVSQVPGKKLWTWGQNGDNWVREHLSDNGSTYVEMQAGAFENQETYQFLGPEHADSFTEYWIPARGIHGVTRANTNGVLYVSRGRDGLTVEFNATRKLPGAKVRILEAEKVIAEQPADLNAATLFSKTFAVPSGSRCTIEVRDGKGELLLGHTEDRYDADSPEPAQLGPQKRPALERKTAEDLLASGERNELNGFPRFALNDYREGLKRAPNNPALLKALGRLDVEQKRFEEANKVLTAAAQASPTDPEVHYYLGVAKAALQDDAAAAREFESAAADHNLHAAATVQLAAARSRTHDAAGALKLVQSIASEQPEIIRAGEIEIALLRHSGNRDEAKAQLQRWRALDPTDSVLRYEAMKLGGGDDLLWQHLAADPDRVLNVAVAYMALGFYDDALDVLSHEYVQPADALASEPGAVLPQRDPLVVYYRGYCRALTGASGREDFEQASKLPLRYIFPNRASSFAVLNAALKANPQDATALDLLGSLYLASDDVDHAIAAWEDARSAHSTDPEMYRNLGRAQLELKKDRWGAIDAYNDGLSIAPDDPVMKKGLEAALRPAPSPATAAPVKSELAQAAPAPGSNPLEFAAYALTLLTSGDIAGAQGVFNARNFPAEKQDPVVRETYIEVQVQGVLQMARAGKCAEANDAEQQIGDLHDELPFTFHGFASILKGPRMQYYLGEVAYICGNEKEARKLWGKAAKSSRPASDIDFVFPYLAASRIEPDGKSQLKTALEQIRAAERSGTPSAAMQYSEAVLLRALGDSDSANKLLATAAKAQDPMLASYLARMALRQRVE